MKKGVIGLIIVGGVLLTMGAILFGIGISKEYKQEELITREYVIKDSVTSFDIDISTADLEFKPLESGNTKVVVTEKEKEYHEVKEEEGVLSIKSVDTKNWYERLFTFAYKKMNITIYMPTETYSKLMITTSTGNISIPSGFTFDNTEIKGSTCDVKYSAASLSGLSITTSTGDINISSTNASGVNLKASTGNVSLVDVKASELNVEVSTGHISLVNTVLTGNLSTHSSTGDVDITDSDASIINIETSTGEVNAMFLTNKIIFAETSTGHINVPHSTSGGECHIKTSTGDITVKIKE